MTDLRATADVGVVDGHHREIPRQQIYRHLQRTTTLHTLQLYRPTINLHSYVQLLEHKLAPMANLLPNFRPLKIRGEKFGEPNHKP